MTNHETIKTPDSPRHSKDRGTKSSNNDQMTIPDIQNAYARYAKWIDRLGWLNRLLTGRFRRRQFSEATGRVLDVACGAGTNFQYVPESTEIVGIDISEPLLERARSELETLERDGTVTQMDAQDLEFEDDSFDTVISSFSTCTFPDRVAALREMARVCRPDGQILLLEHGRSDNDLIARYQEWRADAHYEKSGCRVTQEPLSVVRRAGLSVDEAETAQLGRITRIVCDPVLDETNE
ncbi:class I SAM-dependent methyltransferase [Halobellus marinus]|uniref:class I SAM-dependent methyltransferase n=1 Tax=Halobellus TaxID=1073986 RepID=UPI0028A746C8|nr:class I SAM-dependent methyltransferase [Halobellus sp. DFY28]